MHRVNALGVDISWEPRSRSKPKCC